MSGYKMPVVLFFILGMAPTEDEVSEANKIGAVRFRNASAIGANERPETCDAVAGAIPETYADKPVVSSLAEVMEIMREKMEAEARDADARAVNPNVAIVGKKGKGTKAPASEQVAKTAWQANA